MQALRNIKYTLRKYFVPMLMSLVGLILAFSAFMLISVQLDFEKGFDRFHPDDGNIYRVDLSDNNTIFRSILPPGFSDEVIRSSSHIVAGTVVCPFLGEDTRTIRMEIIQETVLLSLIAFVGAVIAVVFSGNCPAVAHSICRSSDCSSFPLSRRHGNEYNGTDIPSFLIYVTPDFPEVMGIKMTEGKTFPKTSKGDIIVNRYMKDNYGVELGNIPSMEAEAIGICDNVNFTSMRKSQSAVCFISLPAESGYLSDMFVRLASGYDRTVAVSHIKEIISKVEPEYPTEVLFYDNVAAAQYQRENSFANTMLCFSIIAIVLSLVGVFSMVIFDIQHKRKEIALRKVFGADYTDVLWLGNKPYFFIVLAGFIISIPVALIAINEYLRGFAMKIDVSWWIFLLVFLFIQALTAVLVVVRYNSLALESPNLSLETE